MILIFKIYQLSLTLEEMELTRKKIEDEIRAQLENNQQILAEVSKSWKEKVL